MISSQQGALQLRFLQTMVEIGSEKNTTVILPLPIELFKPLIEFGKSVVDGNPIKPDAIPYFLSKALDDRAILCGDSGTVTTWAARGFTT